MMLWHASSVLCCAVCLVALSSKLDGSINYCLFNHIKFESFAEGCLHSTLCSFLAKKVPRSNFDALRGQLGVQQLK